MAKKLKTDSMSAYSKNTSMYIINLLNIWVSLNWSPNVLENIWKLFWLKMYVVLAGVAQWIKRQPANQKVASRIPNQGTCLGWEPGHQEGASEWKPHIGVSLPLFLPPFPSV